MLGTVLSLCFAATFGLNTIITRRGVLRASPSFVANISIFTGPFFFIVVALLAGEVFKMGQIPWQAYAFFAGSGVVHFALGRTFGYKSLQLIGTTRSGIVVGLNAIVSVVLAMVILQEKVTLLVALGIVLSLSGPIVMALKEDTVSTERMKLSPMGKHVDRATLYRGLLYGIGASVFWGSSAIFIKLGLEAGGSSIAGSLIAFTTAALVISPSLLRGQTRQELRCADAKCFQLAVMSGMTTNIAQLLRYLALAYGSVITVSLVSRTIPIWTLMMAFMFNRKVESFTRWVFIGNALLLIGTVLVIIEQVKI